MAASQIPSDLKVKERGILKAGQMIIVEDGKIKKFDQILRDLQKTYTHICLKIVKIERKKLGM
jgi:hypothetical protein